MPRSLRRLDPTRTTVRRSDAGRVVDGGIYCSNFVDSYRWTSTVTDGGSLAQGEGITLRWSIANDNQALTLNNNPVGSSNLVSYLDGIYGSAGE